MRIPDRTEELREFAKRYLSRNTSGPKFETNGHATENGLIPDERIIEEALKARNGDKFRRLLDGDLSGYGGDHSSADHAFVHMLYFWTQDPEQIRRIHGASGLAREKSADRPDYLDRSIQRAAESSRETYPWSRAQKRRASNDSDFEDPADSSDSSDSFFQVKEETTPFPVDAMPVKTRAFIRETAAAIDCPVELVAVPVVATLSAALGHAREVEVKRGHEQSAAIYALGIADSGSGKSPAASKAQKPLKTIQSENNKKYKESLEIYEQQMRVHAASAKRARKNVEPEPEPPSKPVFKRTWVENITIEALAPRLEQNPYGLGLFHDELTGWIRGFDQYKSGGKGDTRQQYLKIWSNDSIAIDRKGDDETIILERPYLTVYGTIQPRLIEDMGVDREDGFINRFLMAYPGPHIARENDEEISYQSEISYEELVKELYKLRPRGVGEKSTLIVKFNRSARELYKEHSNRLASNAGNPATPRGLRDTYPKLRAYLARLSLLMATCREIESGGDTEITRRDVEAAATLMEYFEGVAKKVHHEIASSDTETRIAFELFSLLNRSGGHKTATADEFRRALPLAPDTPEATSKLLRKIVKKHPELILEDGWRGKERVMKISLVEKTVGTVGTDGGGPDEDAGDDEAGYV